MANRYKGITLFIITVLILFYITTDPNTTHSMHSSTLQEQEQSTQIPEQIKVKKKTKTKPQPLVNQDISIEYSSETNIREYSYLQWHNKFILASDCAPIFWQKDTENYDYLTAFKEKIGPLSKNRQTQATDRQLESYQIFVGQCLSLLNEVQYLSQSNFQSDSQSKNNQNNQNIYTSQLIKKTMKDTKAITDEEISLKQAYAESDLFDQLISEIIELNKGKATLTDQQLIANSKVTTEIRLQLEELEKLGGRFYESQEYQDLLKQLKEANNLETSSRQKDQGLIAEKIRQFKTSREKLEKQLYTPFASVFRQIYTTLNQEKTFSMGYYQNKFDYGFNVKDPSLQTIKKEIYTDVNIADLRYFNPVLSHAVLIYLCYLGEDCSQESRWVRNICSTQTSFYDNKSVYYEACGMDLESFYGTYFLSDNQSLDVDKIFNYLVDKYAH